MTHYSPQTIQTLWRPLPNGYYERVQLRKALPGEQVDGRFPEVLSYGKNERIDLEVRTWVNVVIESTGEKRKPVDFTDVTLHMIIEEWKNFQPNEAAEGKMRQSQSA
jgi:hypothetical protein